MGNVELFHSRRTNYFKCEYWIRDEKAQSGTPAQWVLNKIPSGRFYAKPVSNKSNQMDVINGVWAVDKNYISLQTDDNIPDISRGSIVKFNDELWLVEAVQREIHLKESEFSKNIYYLYTITLVTG